MNRLIFLETLYGSTSFLNIYWIVSQICNSTIIGRHFQVFPQITGRHICESQNWSTMFLLVPHSQHFSHSSSHHTQAWRNYSFCSRQHFYNVCFQQQTRYGGGLCKQQLKETKNKAQTRFVLKKGILFNKWCKSDPLCHIAPPYSNRLVI